MKKLLALLLAIVFVNTYSFNNQRENYIDYRMDNSTITLSGKFSGQNIFIQNVKDNSDATKYSIQSISVNGTSIIKYINTAAFEIDLRSMGFNVGDAIEIKINHQPNNPPTILNPEVLN